MMRTAIILMLLAAVLTCLTGCGRGDVNRAPIQGEVKLDGKPLEKGSILFVPIEGTHGSVAGGTIENGHYELSAAKGAAVGKNRVEIRSPRRTGRTVQYAPGTSPSAEVIQMVAPQFNSDSTLAIDVKPDYNTANFEVASQ